MDTVFYLSFKHATKGLPSSVTFTEEDFVQPLPPNRSGSALVIRLHSSAVDSAILSHNGNQLVIKLLSSSYDNSYRSCF